MMMWIAAVPGPLTCTQDLTERTGKLVVAVPDPSEPSGLVLNAAVASVSDVWAAAGFELSAHSESELGCTVRVLRPPWHNPAVLVWSFEEVAASFMEVLTEPRGDLHVTFMVSAALSLFGPLLTRCRSAERAALDPDVDLRARPGARVHYGRGGARCDHAAAHLCHQGPGHGVAVPPPRSIMSVCLTWSRTGIWLLGQDGTACPPARDEGLLRDHGASASAALHRPLAVVGRKSTCDRSCV
jgi:hypothetical protein